MLRCQLCTNHVNFFLALAKNSYSVFPLILDFPQSAVSFASENFARISSIFFRVGWISGGSISTVCFLFCLPIYCDKLSFVSLVFFVCIFCGCFLFKHVWPFYVENLVLCCDFIVFDGSCCSFNFRYASVLPYVFGQVNPVGYIL